MNRDSANVADSSSDDQRRLVSTAFDQFELHAARAKVAQRQALRSFVVPGYRILSEIHRGGQGVVYQAIQESTQRKMAIKVLKEGPFADRIELARFEREVDVLSRLNHPHIVAIHDRGLVAGHAYYVMDYVAGEPLDAHVAGADLPVDELLGRFVKVCDAVNFAHLRGVIHRDLKPGNIRIDESGEPRILDFGLAKLVQATAGTSSAGAMTMTGQFVGSLPWASPEQAAGRSDSIDVRTDVYSLGVILYQLLTGRFPYPVTGRIDDVVRHIMQTRPARPATIRRGIDRDLDLILLTCLAKEPERRYQSAGELARDIRLYLADEPVLAAPPTTGYRLRKFVRRNRVLVLAGGAIAAALVLGVIGTTLGLVWAVREQRRTEQQKMIAEESATAARNEAERADREADQARSMNEFMREVLTSVEPENRGADVRLIEVLASASAAAPQRFAGHPLQEAQVRDLLGQIYFRLSMWPEANAEYKNALALWREHAGADDPRALSAEATCAGSAINMGQMQDAEQVLSNLVPRMGRAFGPDDPRTLDARRKLAVTRCSFGREDEAERVLLELRAHPRLADDDDMQIRILQNLISVNRRRLNADDPAQRLTILGQTEPLAREQVERSMRRNGPNSLVTLTAQVRLSQVTCEQGQYQTAADTCRAILKRDAGRAGKCHQVRIEAMHTLAEALHALGDEREPAELHLSRIECLRQRAAADNPAFLGAVSEALRYLDRAGRAPEGESLAREVTGTLLKLGGGHDSMALVYELYVAHFVSMQGRIEEAEPMFRSLLARAEQLPEHRARARLHLFYGSHLARRELFQEAEQQLGTAVELVRDIRVGTWNTHPDDIIVGFIALYGAWGKLEKVEEYQRLRGEAPR